MITLKGVNLIGVNSFYNFKKIKLSFLEDNSKIWKTKKADRFRFLSISYIKLTPRVSKF